MQKRQSQRHCRHESLTCYRTLMHHQLAVYGLPYYFSLVTKALIGFVVIVTFVLSSSHSFTFTLILCFCLSFLSVALSPLYCVNNDE